MSASITRQNRDRIIQYLYEHGVNEIDFSLPNSQIRAALGLSPDDFDSAVALMSNQGLIGGAYMGGPGGQGGTGLSTAGQMEAERIGPITSLRAPEPPGSISVHASHSTVQVGGHGSNQFALNRGGDTSPLAEALGRIEGELVRLNLSQEARSEAQELIEALRAVAGTPKETGVVARLAATSLAGILQGAGSALGRGLLGIFG